MIEKIRCPKCDSSQTRHRIKTNDTVCNICGNIWKIKDGDKVDGWFKLFK